MGGKGSSPPPAPNYSQIANEQAEVDKAALAQQSWANRPTQHTPWGSTSWNATLGYDPATGTPTTRWTQTQHLNAALQNSLNSQFGIAGTRTGIAADITSRLGDQYADPLDYGQFREIGDVTDPFELRKQAEDAAYARSTSRLDPMFDEQAQRLEIKLRNQGLRPGDEAYEAEMDRFGRTRTDAYQTAINEATTAGRGEASMLFGQQQSQQAQEQMLRQQEIAEALQQRGMPLDEINLLLAGQGVQPPAAPGYTSVGAAPGANLMGAAQAQQAAANNAWSAEQAQRQGMMSGMGSLALAGASLFSDRRLKRNIRRAGTYRGFPLYRFTFIGGEEAVGVMADEVNADAVVTHPSGFKVVDYARVG